MPFLGALLKKREDYATLDNQKENQKIYDKYRTQYR